MIEWRPVISYGGRFTELYSVSSLGQIRRNDSGKIMNQTPAGRDLKYLYVRLWDGAGRTSPVHVLVAEAFMGLRAGREINHIDGNQRNNALSNFEFVDRAGNKRHAVAHAHLGLVAWGEKHGMAKLTADAVRQIRAARFRGFTRYFMARFGVSKMAIQNARSGRTWRHLDEVISSAPKAKNTQTEVQHERGERT